ncbi:hypothetical protein [Streptomyces azureus]|uniref:Uncharacterized protein n=1 Tax=Streptomyces azureus TaxID=146537 RepID=A0A0K8PTS3_STRAJ|nr:hypothetical protein [Streptomyces azureus]GAP51123.1 uncharacterized protein SAZU_5983 [Streptomyces azureus]
MADEGLDGDGDFVRRSERVARVGWIAIAGVAAVLGTVLVAVAVVLMAVALAFGYALAVMD